jgi:colanic acid/amylovoran biosynthesis glycosyltransferase
MRSSSLRVLAYHRVTEPGRTPTPNPSLVSATPAVFEQQMRHLARRFRVVSLEEVLDAQRRNRALPQHAVLLTFDDAYRDFGDTAWPILRKYGLPATVFVPTAFPDQPERAFWWDRVHQSVTTTGQQAISLPHLGTLRLGTPYARQNSLRAVQHRIKTIPHLDAMALVEQLCAELAADAASTSEVLGWSELRELAKEGISLAAHTRDHPALTQLSVEGVGREVQRSLEDLKRETGTAFPVFCYPFGLHNDRVVEELRKQGIELAFTCLDGHNTLPSATPLRLRRTVITPRTSPVIFGIRLWKVVSYVDMWRHRSKWSTMQASVDPQEISSRESTGVQTSRIAQIMSRFPKLSETFVLNEIIALESLGHDVEVYPLLRERQPITHPEAQRWTRRAHFHPFVSLPVLRAQVHFLRRRPAAYFRVLFEVLRKSWGSANFFVGALGIFPKSVRFALEMQEKGIDHIHAHFATHPTVAALIVHRLTGIPFSFVAHGSDLHVERRMLSTKVEAAAFAVTVSNFNREVMVRECGESMRGKIHVIHCGVDPNFFSPAQHRRGTGFLKIACVASLEEVKGHRFLIEACRLLRDRGVAFRCQLVGDGPRRSDIEARIDGLGLNDRITLLGGKARSEVAELLGAADVAVLASHPTADGKREGLPVALIEAMATGLPVVASDLSGIPELVDHGLTGFLVPSGNPIALADALERLSQDGDLRERMGQEGRIKVLRHFDLAANVLNLLELINGDPVRGQGETKVIDSISAAVG